MDFFFFLKNIKYNYLVTGDGKNDQAIEECNFQVIPIENSLKDVGKGETRKNLTVEVSSEFTDYIDMNPEFHDFRTESENSR